MCKLYCFIILVLFVAVSGFSQTQYALQFNSVSSQYVTFGVASNLATPNFTVEIWFKRTGTGTAVSTGTGGVTLVPLIAKGSPQAEGSNLDGNYILGIRSSDNVLAADFEEGTGSASPGLNHPIPGVTPISNNVWYHAAATFTNGVFKIYLNGNLENTLNLGSSVWPQGVSIQHAGLATMLTSTGARNGYFTGILDEPRIWNYARTQQQIQDSMNIQITSSMGGLLGRWGLNDGSGATALNTVSGSPNGTLTNGPVWTTDSPFNSPTTPPTAPSGLSAVSNYWHQVNLSWIDNSNNETAFEIERSTSGGGGPFTSVATVGGDITSYANTGLNEQTIYYYRVRATNSVGNSDYTAVAGDTTLAESSTSTAIDFGGTNSYVTFGNASALGLAQFTIETWFRRDGTGATSSTGTGGVTAIPLVTKGRGEADNSNVDMNYFLGIRSSDNVLCADFEEGSTGSTPGLNHPIIGTTPIINGTWYHASVTYDGNQWQLFLNGMLDAELTVGQPVRSNSIQHAALASALNSTGTPEGYFDGVLDEVRIWNFVRTQEQILNDINNQITTAQSGLVARWGLNENTGSNVYSTAGTSVNGTIQGVNYAWTSGAPFNLPNPPAIPPAAPTNLVSGGVSSNSVLVSWTDNSNNETNFQVERSTIGSSGPFTLIGTVAVNRNYYTDTDVSAVTNYYYRVRATNTYGNSIYSNVLHVLTSSFQNNAVNFDAGSCHVSFGTGTALNTPTFTVETWFKRTGVGVSVTTGSGGVPDAIPLIAKGTSETEDVTKDINYFLAIKSATNTLCADFEEGSTGSSPSLNHPVVGVTQITLNKWYHAAVTYDGSTWRLYLNGKLETELFIGQPTGSATTSPVSLATSMQSNGTTAQGYFYGVMDEARIWNYARTQSQILSTINSQISSAQSGLIACWGMNEGAGSTVYDSSGSAANGTISGTGWSWTVGSPFNVNFSPATPTLISPPNGVDNITTTPTLSLSVSDPNQDDLTVKFYGRALPGTLTPTPFTIVVLPDAQYYTSHKNGGTNALFKAQTQWIVNNKVDKNIVYVSQVGDIVEDGDTYIIQWQRADTTMSILENPTPGIPYGIAIGNHDQVGGTTFYNQYFGVSRFAGRPYFGGNYGSNNNNNFQVFSASGMSFIAINLEYNRSVAALHWADSLLKSDITRRGVVISHDITGTGNPAAFSSQGQVTYDSLKDNPNLFLMLSGHAPGEGRRMDVYNGDTVYTLMADYQSLTNGGNGWLRIMEFSPASNQIQIKTYSPTLDQYNTASSSQFNLVYSMQDTNYHVIDTKSNVLSGSSVSTTWAGLERLTQYQWYVTINDGDSTTTGPLWSFTTEDIPVPIQLASLAAAIDQHSNDVLIQWSTISEINNYGFYVQRRNENESSFNDIHNSFTQGNGTTLEPQSYSFKDNTIVTPGIYHYRLRQVDNDGLEHFTFSVSINVSMLSVTETVPLEFRLYQNYPNPFNPTTNITFSLANAGYTTLKVYNILGNEVATLFNGNADAGKRYEVNFNAQNLGSGMYFYKLQSGSNVEIKKLTLVK